MILRLACLTAILLSSIATGELALTLSGGGKSDARIDRFPALDLQAGSPVSPFLPNGQFSATWTGQLVIPQRQRIVFSFEGTGTAILSIDGKEVLSLEGDLAAEPSARIRLNPGNHEFQLEYQSPEDGSAALRIYWEEASFVRQTIPPSAFAALESPPAEAAHGMLVRHGRETFARQNCTKCHAATAGLAVGAMPEMAEIGPVLVGIGERVDEDWLRHWIAAPNKIKPVTHMPALVDATSPEGRAQAADMAAFLASQKLGLPSPAAPDLGLAERGGVIFHELGCIGCHSLPSERALPDPDSTRVPLQFAAGKYLPGQLVAFLQKPEAYHPFTGMPNFRLSDEEANALAAFIRETGEGAELPDLGEFPAGDAARGAELIQSLQCGTCHPGLPMSGTPAGPPLDAIFELDWETSGCIAENDPRPHLPQPNLPGERRESLIAFSKSEQPLASLNQDSEAEFAARHLTSMRCDACHIIDGNLSLWDSRKTETQPLIAQEDGLEERVDQSRPQLTYVGEMLYTDVIERMLLGTSDPEPRPWLAARMPTFAPHAAEFAQGLSRLHGFEPSAATTPAPLPDDAEMTVEKAVEIGRMLVGGDGFGCITCHAVGDQDATAAFEVRGIALELTPDRMRPGFYHRWMDNPKSVNPSTKMPRYAEGNRSQRMDVLDGDANAQFDAIWHYLHSLKNGQE